MKKIIFMLGFAMAASQVFSQCACCAGAGVGSSNGVFQNGKLNLPKSAWVGELYTDFRSIKEGHEHAHEEMPMEEPTHHEETPLKNMFITSAGVRYGLTEGITLSALVPYVFLHTETGNDQGLGDLSIMGTFKLWSENDFNLAFQAGIELPTGEQKSSNFDNTTVVVGSGSYDPMVGLLFSKTWTRFMLQGNALYKHTTKGFEDNYYGSLSVQNVSILYKLIGEKATEPNMNEPKLDEKPSNVGLSVFTGYYGEWLDNIEEEGMVDEDSGFYLGFATLGANLSLKSWSFPLTLSLPVINNVYGEQNEAGARVRLGIIKYF